MSSTVLENIKALNKCRQSLKNGEYGLISEAQFEERMKKRFEAFNNRYPKIFEKTIRGFFEDKDEINRLKLAISTQNDISSGKIAEKEGGVIFGQNLVDTYVKPHLKDLPPEEGQEPISEPTPTPVSAPEASQGVEVVPEPESDSDEEDDPEPKIIGGILNDIVMPSHELGKGDPKKKIKIDSDDESEDEA